MGAPDRQDEPSLQVTRSSPALSDLDRALLGMRSVPSAKAPNRLHGLATLRQFLRAVFTDWASGITGVASAPLAITAQFFDPVILKVLLNLFAVGCFVFAAYWVWRKEHSKVEAFENNLPNLEALNFTADVREAVPDSTFLHLRIKNNPSPLAGNDAEAINVRAHITFYDEDGEDCFLIEGRWSDTPQPPMVYKSPVVTQQPTSDFTRVNFTIGQIQELAIAFKRAGDKVCYPFNHENYQYQDFRNVRRTLSGKKFTAIVEVRGQRVHKRWKLTFENVGWTLQPGTCEAI